MGKDNSNSRYRKGGKYVILLVMISLFASGCSPYEKGCAFRGNNRFTIVEEINEQGSVATPNADSSRGYCTGGAVYGEDEIK